MYIVLSVYTIMTFYKSKKHMILSFVGIMPRNIYLHNYLLLYHTCVAPFPHVVCSRFFKHLAGMYIYA